MSYARYVGESQRADRKKGRSTIKKTANQPLADNSREIRWQDPRRQKRPVRGGHP
jgi:hypothetical protein